MYIPESWPADHYLQSPRTPLRCLRVRPSLALNFEQSPPDQPMFDLQQRRRSVSSSVAAHHSSPLSIPIPAKQEGQLTASAAQCSAIPPGTIPDPPNPLQLTLDKDTLQCFTTSNYSPEQLQTDIVARPCTAPMPGTNVGFIEDDLDEVSSSSKGNGSSLPEVSSYFGMPVTDNADNMDLGDTISEAQQLADMATLPTSFTSTTAGRGVMDIAALDEVEKARLLGNRVHRRDSPNEAEDNGRVAQHPQVSGAGMHATARNGRQSTELDPSNQYYSPIDIEHIVFEDYVARDNMDPQLVPEAHVIAQAQAQMNLQRQAQMWSESNHQQHAVDNTNVQRANNEWGTHGSLYDGTGYGDECSSISPRPSTSSTAPKTPIKAAGTTVYTADCLAQESDAMARDHETLEEVIRAYAAFEEECASGIRDEMIGDSVADVELAERMADSSLGA
jgi:hypothetical protein